MEEREEGEISDGELSDISSEEEYLLRQRLQVLESYNHVLERKEAKRRLSRTSQQLNDGKTSHAHRRKKNLIYDVLLPDLSDISDSDLENNMHLPLQRNEHIKSSNLSQKVNTNVKTGQRIRSVKKIPSDKVKSKIVKLNQQREKLHDHKEKINTHSETQTKSNPFNKFTQSSDESDDEYRNKRRRLEQSVKIDKNKSDLSSLKIRLLNMFSDKTNSIMEVCNTVETNNKILNTEQVLPVDENLTKDFDEIDTKKNLCPKYPGDIGGGQNGAIKSTFVKNVDDQLPDIQNPNSDDDIDILRQRALQTKVQKDPVDKIDHISDSEDSDELRIICLKSKVLRNKMEWRRKIKLRNRLERIPSIDDILETKLNELTDEETIVKHSVDNTDIESVDMEIGVSDGPDTDDNVFKDDEAPCNIQLMEMNNVVKQCDSVPFLNKPDDLEEDEDLLRTKLLTSLTNKLQINKQNQTDTGCLLDEISGKAKTTKKLDQVPNKFIIHIGESDSGSENETTKNLTKMHFKLAENIDFEQRLDVFLKNARKEAENKDISQETTPSKVNSSEKFVPKAVNHLPISGQLEYKLLVKRMADLERLKHIRQIALNRISKKAIHDKPAETLIGNKAKIVSHAPKAMQNESISSSGVSSDLETQIALSRKRIAMESTKVLRLKEESGKMIEKYKMAALELRNIRTAISLNKREITVVQASLASMRHQHQLLLKRSNTSISTKGLSTSYGKSYKKNYLLKHHFKNDFNTKLNDRNKLQSVTVSVVNDLLQKNKNAEMTLAVKLDLSNKTVFSGNKEEANESSSSVNNPNSKKVTNYFNPKIGLTLFDAKLSAESVELILAEKEQKETKLTADSRQEIVNKETSRPSTVQNIITEAELDDYTSPLASMKTNVNWKGDPNGILCPFEVLGACKDSECRYQHPAVRL